MRGDPRDGPDCAECGRSLGAAWWDDGTGRAYGSRSCLAAVCEYGNGPLVARFRHRRQGVAVHVGEQKQLPDRPLRGMV